MMRKKRGYTREVSPELVRDYKLFAIACEGSKREPDYFKILRYLSNKIAVDVIEEIVSEEEALSINPNKSAPKWVLERAVRYIEKEGLNNEDDLFFIAHKCNHKDLLEKMWNEDKTIIKHHILSMSDKKIAMKLCKFSMMSEDNELSSLCFSLKNIFSVLPSERVSLLKFEISDTISEYSIGIMSVISTYCHKIACIVTICFTIVLLTLSQKYATAVFVSTILSALSGKRRFHSCTGILISTDNPVGIVEFVNQTITLNHNPFVSAASAMVRTVHSADHTLLIISTF